MKAIINRGAEFSTLNDKIIKTNVLMSIVIKEIKLGKAKLLIDNDITLMYILN